MQLSKTSCCITQRCLMDKHTSLKEPQPRGHSQDRGRGRGQWPRFPCYGQSRGCSSVTSTRPMLRGRISTYHRSMQYALTRKTSGLQHGRARQRGCAISMLLPSMALRGSGTKRTDATGLLICLIITLAAVYDPLDNSRANALAYKLRNKQSFLGTGCWLGLFSLSERPY